MTCRDTQPADQEPTFNDCNLDSVSCGLPSDRQVNAGCSDNVYATAKRLCTATDVCGDSSTVTQNIKELDTEAPTLTCPPDSISGFACDEDISIPFQQPTKTGDDCAVASVTPECCVEGGIFKRTWTATDACGKTSSCTQQVKITEACPAPK
jgi:hypothetical protein